MGDVANVAADLSLMMTEAQRAAEHLTRAGRTNQARVADFFALFAMVHGKHPASLALIEARRQASTADGRQLRLMTWTKVCFLAQMLGRTEEAHQASEQTESLRVEMRDPLATVGITRDLGGVALACGRAAEAAELLARTVAVHESTGATSYLSTTAGYYAHALLLTGDRSGGRRQVDRALETGSTDDVLTQGLARSALAWAIAGDGEGPAIVRKELAAAVAALEPTDLLLERALVHAAGAEAARLIGDRTAAVQHRQHAIALYDAKENVVGAAVQRALLAAEVG